MYCYIVLIVFCYYICIRHLYIFFFFKQKTAYEMLRSLVGSEMCIRDSYKIRNIYLPTAHTAIWIWAFFLFELVAVVLQTNIYCVVASSLCRSFQWHEQTWH
eukprot:TRINITY_DN52376_c0_g1_i1.p1 TRINITY_DN52376_c0_g1~~TRINITY_DN52376_c0_g1_i1.p1  ORF type:complete len:102 (+),score=9.61 TRINITY_DN52376_c0_g1_i1:6-311(+)